MSLPLSLSIYKVCNIRWLIVIGSTCTLLTQTEFCAFHFCNDGVVCVDISYLFVNLLFGAPSKEIAIKKCFRRDTNNLNSLLRG